MGFLGRTYQGAILQLTLDQIIILNEVAYTEEPESTEVLVFQRDGTGGSDASLEATSWALVSLGDSDSLDLPASGADVTIEFNAGGELRGNAGCNNYFSNNYSAAGGIFVAGAVGSTRMACGEPAGIMEQETRFLELLGAAEFSTVAGETLTLTVPGAVKDYVIRPSSEENQLMAIRTRVGNHAAHPGPVRYRGPASGTAYGYRPFQVPKHLRGRRTHRGLPRREERLRSPSSGELRRWKKTSSWTAG